MTHRYGRSAAQERAVLMRPGMISGAQGVGRRLRGDHWRRHRRRARFIFALCDLAADIASSRRASSSRTPVGSTWRSKRRPACSRALLVVPSGNGRQPCPLAALHGGHRRLCTRRKGVRSWVGWTGPSPVSVDGEDRLESRLGDRAQPHPRRRSSSWPLSRPRHH